jgi:hypothetical protein
VSPWRSGRLRKTEGKTMILKPKLRGGISYAGWRCLLGAWAEPPWDARMQTKTKRETLILRLKIQ